MIRNPQFSLRFTVFSPRFKYCHFCVQSTVHYPVYDLESMLQLAHHVSVHDSNISSYFIGQRFTYQSTTRIPHFHGSRFSPRLNISSSYSVLVSRFSLLLGIYISSRRFRRPFGTRNSVHGSLFSPRLKYFHSHSVHGSRFSQDSKSMIQSTDNYSVYNSNIVTSLCILYGSLFSPRFGIHD